MELRGTAQVRVRLPTATVVDVLRTGVRTAVVIVEQHCDGGCNLLTTKGVSRGRELTQAKLVCQIGLMRLIPKPRPKTPTPPPP
jgi:hypothetical protein